MPKKCNCPNDCLIHDTCSCGAKKQIVSNCCRSCYYLNNKQEPKLCPICFELTTHKDGCCRKCYKKKCQDKILNNNEPIRNYLYKNNKDPNHFVRIRKHAQNVAKALNLYKDGCTCCPFNFGLQVCHIKSIKEFSENTPINVVNSPDNLIILCPNCHWLQDHGYPTIEEIINYLKENNLLCNRY